MKWLLIMLMLTGWLNVGEDLALPLDTHEVPNISEVADPNEVADPDRRSVQPSRQWLKDDGQPVLEQVILQMWRQVRLRRRCEHLAPWVYLSAVDGLVEEYEYLIANLEFCERSLQEIAMRPFGYPGRVADDARLAEIRRELDEIESILELFTSLATGQD